MSSMETRFRLETQNPACAGLCGHLCCFINNVRKHPHTHTHSLAYLK